MKLFFTYLSLILFFGCSTLNITKRINLSEVAIEEAKIEFISYVPEVIPHMTDAQQLKLLNKSIGKILPSAQWACKEYSPIPESCRFIFRLVKNEKFNAFATEIGGIPTVIIYSGIFNKVSTIEEVAFIVAHEIAHHINNHINFAKRNAAIGEITGQVLGIALAGVAMQGSSSGSLVNSVIDYGSSRGGTVGGTLGGQFFFSALQESEADYTALLILQNSWLNMNVARNAILKITSNMNSEDNFFKTHPSSSDRLAGYDYNLNAFKKVHSNFITNICDDFKRKGFKREFRNCKQLINYDSASETDYFLRMQKTMKDKKFKPSFVIVR